MALLAGPVPARGVDPPVQQEPLRVGRGSPQRAGEPDPRLPHPAGAGRRGAFRRRDLLRRRGLCPHRRRFAGRQGPRTGFHELDAYEAPPVRQVRERAHHDPAVGGDRHGVLRRLHPPQRTEIHHLAGFLRRGDPFGVRQLGTPVPAARRPEELHPHGPHAAGHPLVVEARRLPLPAFRRHLLDLHDPLRR